MGTIGRLKRTRIRRSEQEWSKILARFERVEQSHRELCQREELALSTFQWWWRHKLGRVHRGRKSHDSAWFVVLSEETCCPATFSPRHCATPRIARPDYGISSTTPRCPWTPITWSAACVRFPLGDATG